VEENSYQETISPKRVDISKSHERLKKEEYIQNSVIRNPVRVNSISNRIADANKKNRVFPDRDISP